MIMSMNLYLEGKKKAETVSFPLWQTPTTLTKEVLGMSNLEQKVKSYVKWADSVAEKNESKNHVKELREWLFKCEEEDFSVVFYTL